MNTALLCRPHSYDRPRVDGFEPLIRAKIERVGRGKRNAWRAVIWVADCPMATGHRDTKYAVESWAAGMLKAYAEVHYLQV